MTLHLMAALVALAATMLYADRSAYLYQQGKTQKRWALATRVGIALLLTTIVGSFVNLSATDAPFLLRHWAVLSALVLVCVGHLGMRVTSSPPT